MIWSTLYIIMMISFRVLSEQRIIEEPSNTRVLIGGTALLKCRIEAQQGAVQWMKNGFGLGNDRDLFLFKRYSMEGSVKMGEYNLRIIDVQMDDDDVYACQVEAVNENPTKISSPARLTVLVQPENPKLVARESKLKVVTGQYVQRSCVSRHGKPPAKIGWVISNVSDATTVLTWLGDSKEKLNAATVEKRCFTEFADDRKQTQNVRIVEEFIRNSDRTHNVISNISFTPTAEDDNKYLVCLVSHETYTTPRSQAVLLDVDFPPKVEVKLSNNSRLYEHGSALLFCNVTAKPVESVSISWYHNGKEITAATTDTLSFPELRIDHHQSQYTCVAKNAIGDSSDSIVLNVTYGPYIMSSEQHKAVNPGETVSFICEAIGNPLPTVQWTKVGYSQVIARGNNFTIESVQNWQRGEYECTATVHGFPPAHLINYLHIKGPPSVSMKDEIFAANGESLEVVCEVRGRPQPQDVIWSLNGVTLEYKRLNGRIQIHQIPRQFGVESRLVIQSVKDSDFGIYNCTAYNELGRDFQIVEVKPINMLEAFIGIMPIRYFVSVAFLLLLVSITLIYCGYRVRRQNSCKKAIQLSDDHSDVNVKCEALDGGHFFPAMYNSTCNESHELLCSRDYISLPQSNPDLDYLPPPSLASDTTYIPYVSYSANHDIDKQALHIDHPYNSFASAITTTAATESEPYGYQNSKGNMPLEILAEVALSDTECSSSMLNSGIVQVVERPASRTSTHV